MGTVLVTGGTGSFGRQSVPRLAAQGHEVRVLSRRPGAGSHRGDLTTGAGLDEAVAGVDVVVHAASDTRRLGRADERQTANLLAAARAAGVGHVLYLSIVGVDAVPLWYYRRKLACEEQVADSGLPWTVLRATQFHELVAEVLRRVGYLPVAPLPLRLPFQPVAAGEVADRVVGLVDAGPSGRAADFGGPEIRPLGELARTWRARTGRPRALVDLPLPGALGQAFGRGLHTCPDHAIGLQTWAAYVEGRPFGSRRA